MKPVRPVPEAKTRAVSRLLAAAVVSIALAGCSSGSEPGPAVASVEVTPNAVSRRVGESVQLSAAVKDADGLILNGQTVTWTSSNTTVASVSAAGVVMANAVGVASISAAAGGHSGSAVVSVVGAPVATVTVSPMVDTILVGETVTLSAVLRDGDGNVLTDRSAVWTSSDPTIASVGLATGLVTGVADGDATISATAENKSASSVITVFGPCSIYIAPAIGVGDVVQGSLTTTDCRLDDGSYADGYYLKVATDTDAQIDMTSQVFSTYIWILEWLANGDLKVVSGDNQAGTNPNDSRLTFTFLGGRDYFILANSYATGQLGAYELSVMQASPGIAGRVVGTSVRTKRASPEDALRSRGKGPPRRTR